MKSFENQIPKNKNFGLEREEDPKKSLLMARVENVARDKASLYEDYLNNPNNHIDSTGGKSIAFALWRSLSYGPSDIIDLGRMEAEMIGKNYDTEKKVQSLEKEGSKIKLTIEALKETCTLVLEVTKGYSFMFRYSEKDKLGFKKFIEQNYLVAGSGSRLATIIEAITTLNKGGRENQTEDSLWEESERMLDSFNKHFTPKNQPEERATSTAPGTREGFLASLRKVITNGFNTYQNLDNENNPEINTFRTFFKEFKEAGLASSDLEKNINKIFSWVEKILTYKSNLEKLDDGEILDLELNRQWIASMLEFANGKSSKTVEYLFDIASILVKTTFIQKEINKRGLTPKDFSI